MKAIKLITAIMTVVVLAGCYDMKQDDKGRTVKVNKLTGEIYVIEGDRLIKLKGEKEVKVEQDAAKKLGEAKTWPVIPLTIAGGAEVRLITKWSNGFMYYQFFINKNLRGKGNYLSRLTIKFHDDASFLIDEIPVPVSSMTGVLSLDGRKVQRMEYKGQRLMEQETYKKIRDWNVGWSGFNN